MIDAGDDKKDTTLDYLGQPAERSFKSQPALPVGGPIGVGAGPATSSAGAGIGAVRRQAADAEFSQVLQSLGIDPAAGGDSAGGGADAAAGSPSGASAITGFDPGSVVAGLNTAGKALGFPGVPGIAGLALKGGLNLGELGAKFGKSDLTVTTPEGKSFAAVPGARATFGNVVADTLASFFGVPVGALLSAVAITGTKGDAQAIANALANPEATLTPDQLSMIVNAVITQSAQGQLSLTAPGITSEFGGKAPSTTSVFGADPATAFALANNRGSETTDAPGDTGPPGDPGPGPGVSGQGGPGSGTGVSSGDTTE